jgi:hypothetical protein
MACGSHSEECWSYGVFLAVNNHQQGKTASKRVRRIWKIFFDEERSLKLTEDLEAWSLGYLSSDHRLKVKIRNMDSSRIKVNIFILFN